MSCGTGRERGFAGKSGGGLLFALGNERDEIFALGVKVAARHGQDFLRGHGLDVFVVAGAQMGIALIEPAASEGGGLAGHGFLAVDLVEKALAFGAVEFAELRRFLLKQENLMADFGDEGLLLVRRAADFDAPEAVIGRGVGEGVELLGQGEFFDAALVEARAAPAAGQHGQEIKRGRVGVIESAHGPAEGDPAELGGKFAAKRPALVLAGFVREIEVGHFAARNFFEKLRRAGEDGFRRDGAADDQAEILRSVTLVVVGQHVVARELVEEIEVADDGMAVGMPDKGGLEDELAEFGVGVVAAHGELAADDFHLLREFLGGDGRVEYGVAQDLQRRQRVVRRKIDVIDGAVEGGVGVEVAAEVLDLLRHLAVAAGRRALEHKVFEEVGEAGAKPRRFVDAAGGAPELDRDDRRGEVGLDEDAEAVGKLANRDRRRRDQWRGTLRLLLKACV